MVRVCSSAASESVCSIAVTVWLLPGNSTAEHICTCISCGAAAGDFVSMLIVLLCYFSAVRGKKDEGIKNGGIAKTAFPLAVSSYMRIGLSSAGHILIPFGLKKSAASAAQSFAVYGIIHQMAFPVITFPAAALARPRRYSYPEADGRAGLRQKARYKLYGKPLAAADACFRLLYFGIYVLFCGRNKHGSIQKLRSSTVHTHVCASCYSDVSRRCDRHLS